MPITLINNTKSLNSETVEELITPNLKRLELSKTKVIQISCPVGYLIVTKEDIDVISATLEPKFMGRLD